MAENFTSLTQFNHEVVYPIPDYLSHDKITLKYHAYLSTLSTVIEPTSYLEAVKDPN